MEVKDFNYMIDGDSRRESSESAMTARSEVLSGKGEGNYSGTEIRSDHGDRDGHLHQRSSQQHTAALF